MQHDKRLVVLDGLPLSQRLRQMVLAGCSPSLVRQHCRVSKDEVTAVRREIERSGQGKKIQHQPRQRDRD